MCKIKYSSLNIAHEPITESTDNVAADELNCWLLALKYSSDVDQSTKKELMYSELAIFRRQSNQLPEIAE